MRTWHLPVVILTLLALSPLRRGAAEPIEVPLGPQCVLRFATERETATVLAAADDYLTRLSLRDRQIRAQKTGEITPEEFARFLAGEALAWQPPQIDKLKPVVASLAARLKEFQLPLPPVVLLGLTSGREEDNAAYTRGNTIVLPRSKIEGSAAGLERLLAHELFHVLSRHNPALRKQLYALVGFQPCGEIALPEALAARALHNPDAPVGDYAIEIRHGGENLMAVPVLLAAAERPGAGPPGHLFRVLEFRLLALEQVAGRWQPKQVAGAPLLLDPAGNDSYFAQVGRNTAYIIHPEEILADNFMHLVFGTKKLPNPELVARLREELSRPAEK